MSYKTSTQGTYFSQFTNDEKIAYALNLSLAKVTTDAFKAGYEWYNSPDLFNAISKQSILSDSIPKYNEINNYYCIITVNGVEYITNKTVDNILTYQGGFKLSEILGTNTEILNGTSNENSNPPTSSDFNSDGLCTKLPRQAFAYFVYWKNKLTGLGGTGNNANGTSGGLWPHSDDSLSLKLTLNSDGSNNADRTYSSVIANEDLMTKLQDYIPLKIINPSFISGAINQTNGIPEDLKQYVNKKIVINVGVPTISTWNGLSNSNNSDNIAFFNPLLTKSLNEPYGYNGNGLGNGYWIRGTDSSRTNIRPDYGSSAVGEGTMIFSAMTGFILFFGVSNILTNSTGVSVKNPPCVTALRYIGETFSDGIISQGDTLPAVEVSNEKDLFINTSDNTIHRLTINDSGDKEWVGIGGSGGGGSTSSGETYDLTVSNDLTFNGVLKHVNDIICRKRLPSQPIETKITASDGAASDYFGRSVAISGDYAIVGAKGDDSSKGSAYIFERDANGDWTQTQKLLASERANNDYFGYSVAISGNYAIVGAYGDDSETGSAYIFERDANGNWGTSVSGQTYRTETKKLLASDADTNDKFGFSVAISGNYAIVGTLIDHSYKYTGSAYIFERDADGNWGTAASGQSYRTETKKLKSSETIADYTGNIFWKYYDKFGISVAISGDYAIVGAIDVVVNDSAHTGSAYIFERDTDGNWGTEVSGQSYRIETKRFLASDRGQFYNFSYSVAISGDYAIVGSYTRHKDNENNRDTGAAYIFERDADGNWGTAVSGESYRTETKKFYSSDGAREDHFGYSVAISGNYAIVGADADDDIPNNSGSAYIFERDADGNWGTAVSGQTYRTETKKLLASDGAASDYFGISVAISGYYTIYYAIVGAYGDDDIPNNSGSAYIFKLSESEITTYDLTVSNDLTVSGNVGIGYTNPQDLIHTTGNIRIGQHGIIRAAANAWNHTGTITLQSAGSGNNHSDVHPFNVGGGCELKFGKFISPNVYGLTYKQNNIIVLCVDANRNVGIGTTSPSQKLHINGGNVLINEVSSGTAANIEFKPSYYIYTGSTYTSGDIGKIIFTNQTSGQKSTYITGHVFSGDHIPSIKFTGKTYWNGDILDIMTIRGQSGRVGIGTTSPSTLLVVGEDGGGHATNTPGIHMKSIVGQTNKYYVVGQDTTHNLHMSYQSNSTVQNGYGILSCYGGNNNLVLQHSGGNVGIGTTSPQLKLDVHGNDMGRRNITGSVHDADKRNSFKIGRWDGEYYDKGFLGIELKVDTATNMGYGVYNNQTAIIFNTWGSNYANSREVMRIRGDGRVGIGTTSPICPLHVNGSVDVYTGARYYNSSGGSAYTTTNRPLSAYFSNHISCSELQVWSDQRIKENIVEIDDGASLQKVRDISCVWYNYKDKVANGYGRVAGFLSQQVKEHLPEAVSLLRNFIPNEMRILNDVVWDISNNMKSELKNVSGIKYKFYVSNDISGNVEIVKEVVGNQDDTFTFDASYNNIFCYGKEVDDFHTLDKSKLFAINFSATQEIDRIQQQQLLDISGNRLSIESNRNELELLKLENQELKTELNIVKLQNQTLQERLEAIEKRLYDANI